MKDWSFYDFKIFIKCLYTDVNLENYNIMTLCELYYIADFYNVSEMKVWKHMVTLIYYIYIMIHTILFLDCGYRDSQRP